MGLWTFLKVGSCWTSMVVPIIWNDLKNLQVHFEIGNVNLPLLQIVLLSSFLFRWLFSSYKYDLYHSCTLLDLIISWPNGFKESKFLFIMQVLWYFLCLRLIIQLGIMGITIVCVCFQITTLGCRTHDCHSRYKLVIVQHIIVLNILIYCLKGEIQCAVKWNKDPVVFICQLLAVYKIQKNRRYQQTRFGPFSWWAF